MNATATKAFGASLAVALLLPSLAAAQDYDDDGVEVDASADVEADVDVDVDANADAYGEADEGSPLVTTTDYSDENPTPPAGPGFMDSEEEGGSIDVAHDAGVGSPLAYARASVLELGGTLAFQHQSDTTRFSIGPSIGYFLVDGLELTLFARFDINHITGGDEPGNDSQTDISVAAILEPSYHLAITEAFYIFAGTGLGVTFAKDPVADFIFRPRVGVDLLIGRSAIFKPAFYMEIGVAEGLEGMGVEGSFYAMW